MPGADGRSGLPGPSNRFLPKASVVEQGKGAANAGVEGTVGTPRPPAIPRGVP
jgi:hypothetical protein